MVRAKKVKIILNIPLNSTLVNNLILILKQNLKNAKKKYLQTGEIYKVVELNYHGYVTKGATLLVCEHDI